MVSASSLCFHWPKRLKEISVLVLVQMFSSFSTVLPKFKVWIDVPDAIYHEDALWGSVTAK